MFFNSVRKCDWQKWWRIVLFCYIDDSRGLTEDITKANTATTSHISGLLSSSTAEKGIIYVQYICLFTCYLFAVFIIVIKLVIAKFVVI